MRPERRPWRIVQVKKDATIAQLTNNCVSTRPVSNGKRSSCPTNSGYIIPRGHEDSMRGKKQHESMSKNYQISKIQAYLQPLRLYHPTNGNCNRTSREGVSMTDVMMLTKKKDTPLLTPSKKNVHFEFLLLPI